MTAASSCLLKNGAFSAFPLIPVLVIVSYYAGLPWLVPAFVFIGIPVLDYLTGTDLTPPLSKLVPAAPVGWLRAIPRI